MPDLGIGEALAAFGGADVLGDIGLGGLFGGGDAAAAAGGTGAIGGAGAADLLAPSGAGLFGGATGLAGTELAAGAGTDLAALTATGGLSAAGTAADFLAAPGASGFNAAALTPGIGDIGGGPGILQPAAPSTPTGVGGTDVFGAPPTTAPPQTAPANILGTGGGAGGAAGAAAPAGVSGAPDATAALPSSSTSIPGASGPTSVGGAPLNAGPTSSIDSLLGKFSPSNLASSAVNSLTNNPLGVGAGLAGLGYTIYEGQKNTANEAAQTAAAQQAGAAATSLSNQGNQLTSYLTNGTLPPQYQTQITQAIQSAIANAKSNAAQQGLSTDPTQNTALAMQIQEIQNQQPILQEQIAQQLATTGTTLISDAAQNLGLSGNLYQSLVANDTTQAANAGKAIAALAAALSGKGQVSGSGSGGTTVTIG
jgi:hypothetical protein